MYDKKQQNEIETLKSYLEAVKNAAHQLMQASAIAKVQKPAPAPVGKIKSLKFQNTMLRGKLRAASKDLETTRKTVEMLQEELVLSRQVSMGSISCFSEVGCNPGPSHRFKAPLDCLSTEESKRLRSFSQVRQAGIGM